VKLVLYSSRKGNPQANLVALQSAKFSALPTVLVCPLILNGQRNPLRPQVRIYDQTPVVYTDLPRPIRRTALTPAGELSPADSRIVMRAFLGLLAQIR
jgi:hypothetical protein